MRVLVRRGKLRGKRIRLTKNTILRDVYIDKSTFLRNLGPKKTGGVNIMKNYKIAVAGTGYVGLSIATSLSQHHQVTAVDIVPEKVELINNHKSPIQDDYIEKYLAEKELNLTATLDAKAAYSDADFVVIAAPTNVYSTNRIDVASSKRTCFAH